MYGKNLFVYIILLKLTSSKSTAGILLYKYFQSIYIKKEIKKVERKY